MKKTIMLLVGACLSLGLVAAASAETFSTKAFSVEVPEEAMELADIEADEQTISFYETQSHQAGMGYIGTIELFDKEEDYCYIPHFEWAGIIVTPEGAEKQVVVNYPSDVQVDFSKDENIDRYHSLSDLFKESILPSLTAIEGEYLKGDQVNHKSIYDETLAKLKEMIDAKAAFEDLEEAGFSYLYSYLYEDKAALGQLQVAYVDFLNTGYPLMAILAEDGSVIYDLFAQKDGQVLHVFSGGERDRFSFIGHEGRPNSILEVASGGALYTEFNTFDIDAIKKELFLQTKFIYDGNAENGPYLVQYSFGEPEAVSEEEWNQRRENFGETITVPGTPLFNAA